MAEPQVNEALLDSWVKAGLMYMHSDGAQAWTEHAKRYHKASHLSLLGSMLYKSREEFDYLLSISGYKRDAFLHENCMDEDGVPYTE